MSEQVLNVLKLCLLGLIYLFFARVLWAVWSEVRTPVARQASRGATSPQARPSKVATGRAPKGRGTRAARLVLLAPQHPRGTTLALQGEITRGPDDAATISIQDDSYISAKHLRIYDYDGQPMVEDLGSTNGTFHNGNRMTGTKLLQRGDRIQVGTTVIEAQ